ncbi:MAG TPA: hypothetical protein DGG95_06555 [Cytophagales bacterium]|nr:hypothetical protein [Cytophagales bacterium]
MEAEQLFLFKLSLGFVAIAVFFVVLVFTKRFIKIWRDQEKEWFLKKIVPLIGSMVIVKRNRLEWRRDIKLLVSLIGRNHAKQQIAIDHLMHLKSNLEGESAGLIFQLYRDLNLVEFSRNKLRQTNWTKQTEGVRELASMNCYFVNVFSSLLQKTKQVTLRNELIVAMTWLDKKEPFRSFRLINFELTDWLKLNIYDQLKKYNRVDLPDFSPWICHERQEVATFFIWLAKTFNQTSSSNAIAHALSGAKTVANAALDSLIEMRNFSYTQKVEAMISNHWICPDTSLLILCYLEGTDKNNFVQILIDRFRFHPYESVMQKADRLRSTYFEKENTNQILATSTYTNALHYGNAR